ncbi:hypothetical protein [Haloechinothrix sp. LS1_15]|uniref:hypothetical protein n=1 Tax=Haloechinothrix sp. LS1_15 TaxID=2652248 RepID=UPI002947F66C|nr:hypothetical protein [Haloechinothrix sp. LS1_15]MDV6012797.1 hypothetical protein [Haloechinothrix sp. LS1_15]
MAPDPSQPGPAFAGSAFAGPARPPSGSSGSSRRGLWVALFALVVCLLVLIALVIVKQPERLAGEAAPATTAPAETEEPAAEPGTDPTDDPDEDADATDPDSLLSETVVASDGLSQVRAPAYWDDLPEEMRDMEAVIAIGEPFTKVSVEVFSYPQEDYASFDDSATLTEEWLRSGDFGETSIENSDETTIDGMRAINYEVTAEVDGVNQVLWWVVVRGERAYYDVVGWTVPSEREANEPVITEVMESFEEIDDEV